MSDVVGRAIEQYGEPTPGHYQQNQIDGEWWGLPYINGGGGKFVRASLFEAMHQTRWKVCSPGTTSAMAAWLSPILRQKCTAGV
ncbi:MAG: hypothetical protein R2856_03055 [Caldilineaceae bacterium]